MDPLHPGALRIDDLIARAPELVSLVAIIALLLLLPLYFSQRRDLKRLVVWMERDPGHPPEDVRASEVILDRAEAELEELVGATEPSTATATAPPPAPGTAGTAPAPITAAQRVTSERPALERITMEREALISHPRWRRFTARATQPRWLVAIAAAAVLLGLGAIFGSELLLERGDPERTPRAGAIDPSTVSVAVLNATTVDGLAGKVGDDVTANGYDLGVVSTIAEPEQQTFIMFEKGEEKAARRVARDLGVGPVQPIDRQVQQLANGAEVVVIAGQDRASA